MVNKLIHATQAKTGTTILIEGVACTIKSNDLSTSGRHGHAKCRIDAIGIIDGKKRVIVAPGHDNVNTPIVEKKNAQVLSISGNTANVMDNESYETFDLEIPGDLQGQVKDGSLIAYWIILDDKVMKQVQG